MRPSSLQSREEAHDLNSGKKSLEMVLENCEKHFKIHGIRLKCLAFIPTGHETTEQKQINKQTTEVSCNDQGLPRHALSKETNMTTHPRPREHLHHTSRRRFTMITPTVFVTLHTYVPLSLRVTLYSVRLVSGPVPFCSTVPFGAVHVSWGVGLPSTSHTNSASSPSTAVTFSFPEPIIARTGTNITRKEMKMGIK